MAIGRVAGPMLLSTLDRQGTDLSFVTDPGTGTQTLVYLDFTNFRMGVNTTITTERLTVEGNISVNSSIVTSALNRHMYLTPNGTGQVIVSNVNILKGNINSTDIGTTIAAAAKFTTANTSAKATFASAQVTNLTAGRVPFVDGTGLTDSTGLLFFTGNNTLYATNLESAGTVGYLNLNITGNFVYNLGTPNYVPFFAANNQMIVKPGMQYFTGNSTFRANTVQLANVASGQILYTVSNNAIIGGTGLLYDGTNFTATGTTTLAGLKFGVGGAADQTITGAVLDQNINIRPLGAGTVDFGGSKLTNLGTPVSNTDAVTLAYVQSLLTGGALATNVILQNSSSINVTDIPSQFRQYANVTIAGVPTASFTAGYSYFGQWQIYQNQLRTVSGDAVIVPDSNGRIELRSTKAVVLPAGLSAERPTVATIGDFRYNTELGTVEWWTGSSWSQATGGYTLTTQKIIPSGVTRVFTLNQNSSSESALVSINGVVQMPTDSYAIVGNQLTMVDTPVASDIIEVRFLASQIVYATNPIYVSSAFVSVATSVGGTTLDSFYSTQYRSANYEWVAKNTTTGQYQTGEAFVVHNNITANAVAQIRSLMGTSTAMITWTTNIDGFGVVNLVGTAAGAGTVVKLHRTYFTDN
jgi:hypothetical protein